MPLYDYACDDCGFAETLHLKLSHQKPLCPNCGSDGFNKQMAPFQTTGLAAKSASPSKGATSQTSPTKSNKNHTHSQTSSCGHSKPHAHDSGGCMGSRVDKLIKKHEKQSRPITIS